VDSPEGWWRRVDDKQAVARIFHVGQHRREGWEACGMAVEFALKAIIHKREGFLAWPASSIYRTHDLDRLLALAGLSGSAMPVPVRLNLKVVLQWEVGHRYRAAPLPAQHVLQMFDATFGEHGVISWLRTR